MRLIATIWSAATAAILLVANQAQAIPLTNNFDGPALGRNNGADNITGKLPVDRGVLDAGGSESLVSNASATNPGLNPQLQNAQNNVAPGRPIPAIGKVTDTTWGTTATVPEPGVLALSGLGLLGLAASRRRAGRRRAAPQR